MRFLLLRLLPLLLLFWAVRIVLRSFFATWNSQVAPSDKRQAPRVSRGGELKKDPVCGTYVSTEVAVTSRVNGETVHFCSAACRDKYRAAS
ncbi:MAG TPA: hypothetical protein VMI94_08140 [Bryobacteraceae bacterium]|nr:hypothetical protein [Bryobacteraceae bacterium]